MFILQALKENGYGGFLYSIDKEVNPLVLNGYPHKQNWKMVVGDSTIRLPRLLRDIKTINHFHHDSLHTYNNMMFEYKTALRQLSHNGVITSHDVLLSPITRNPFRDLCKTHGLGKKNILNVGIDEDREQVYKDYGEENRYIEKTMLAYTRYNECKELLNAMQKHNIDITRLSVLDFGSLVSDYSVLFSKLGCRVSVYDFEPFIKFVKYRFRHLKIPCKYYVAPMPFYQLFMGKKLVIFSEVLEHLRNPIQVLKWVDICQVKYIFTTWVVASPQD